MTEVQHLRIVRDAADAPTLPLGNETEPAQSGTELAAQIFDGEIVDDGEPQAQAEAGLPALRTIRLPLPLPVPSERTVTIARGALAAAVTTAQGSHSWTVRAWDSLTLGVYRRQIRSAEAAGDREALAEWQERHHQAITRRRDRLAGLPVLAWSMTKFAGGVLAGGVVLTVGASTLVWAVGAAEWMTIPRAIATAIRWGVSTVEVLLGPALVAAPVAIGWAAWREGRRRSEVPAWVAGDSDDTPTGRDVIPDESAILAALRHLELAPLNKAFKSGWRPRFVLPTERDGKGYHTQLELPRGVNVEMINNKKKLLAHNLVRFPVEVWPTEPRDKPGVLDLWVADQGALSGPVDPWPLLHKGSADYFRGVPVAVDIRGRTIIGRLSEANYAAAGMMGSGKSTLFITLLLGALLDPLVTAEVFVMADNADYEPMQPRLRTLRTGQGDDVVEACMAALRRTYNELSVRGKALREHDARAVTRELAEKDERLRPRILVIDECQALFMHEEFGEEAAEIAVKLESAARKYAVTLMYATPEPSTDSLPRRLISITSNKACFAIGDQLSNDAILGTGSYKAGISAVGLVPKTDEGPGDVGTFMGRGFTPRPGLLRGYYVSQSDARAVVERAMKLREQAGITSGTPERRDLLEDLAAVLGGQTIKAADVPALLREHAPQWAPYRSLTGKQLVADLADLGVKVPSTGNRWEIDAALIREALNRRQADEEQDES
ncbi:hypothetical protein [Streptosporangium jomthongense]|uniref:Cell division protein FtsK n=1 Tax=Streptosporangium jomthongense TaxID=1193683 RepID=A0ABV8EVD9_9ACTN